LVAQLPPGQRGGLSEHFGARTVDLGGNSVLLGPMTAGLYHAGGNGLAAWRLPGEQHQFLTLEYSRAYLERNLKGHELSICPALRAVLHRQRGAPRIARVFRLTVGMRKAIEAFRHPPVAGPAQGLWYQGKALEVVAEFCFVREGEDAAPRSRQTEVGQQRVERAIEILTQRLAEPPSLEELGREVGCSQYHLSRTFSREMGLMRPQLRRGPNTATRRQ
jgi:hypothetical protein